MSNDGVRIQKVLSDHGILSRRKAEEAIRQGRVQVNGRPAEIGQKINPRRDLIALDGAAVSVGKRPPSIYLMLHKPRGYITTTSDERGRDCVMDLVADAPDKVYPIGRLDKQSEGLLLFTNDGAFANQMMHPSNQISKTYRVTVRSMVSEDQLIRLATGVEIDGKKTLPASVHTLSTEAGRSVLQLTIFEGRNRQVRKMCEGVGLTVARLKRTSVGPLKLGMLPPGEWRQLTPAELLAIRGAVRKGEKLREQGAAEEAKSSRPDGRPRKPGQNPKARPQRPGSSSSGSGAKGAQAGRKPRFSKDL